MGARKRTSQGASRSPADPTRRGGGRPRQGRALARHLPRDEEILHIAAQVLYEKGFEVTVEEIARASGIVRGSFYNYFRSKEEVYERILRQISGALDAGQEPLPEATALERLRTWVDAQVRLAVTFPAQCGLMVRVMHSTGPLADALRGRATASRRTMRELILAGQREGSVRSDDPDILVNVAVSVLQRVPEWYAAHAGRVPDDVIQTVSDFVMHGLATPGAGAAG